MLVQKYTRYFLTEHRPVEEGLRLTEEGLALVYAKQGTETVVRPSTGAEGEVFAGFSLARNSPPTTLPWVGQGVVPASGQIELPRLPLATQILIKVQGEVRTVKAAAPENASEVLVAARVITFHADDVGSEYYIQMQYEPTVSEARTLIGDAPIGGVPSGAQDQIGVITRGDVATTLYDASADFSTVFNPSLGPDGILTVGGSGTVLTNVQVVSTPSADNTALVVRVNV